MACGIVPNLVVPLNEVKRPSFTSTPQESGFVTGSKPFRGGSAISAVFRPSTVPGKGIPESSVVGNPCTTCCFCQKDFETVPFLQAHLKTQKHPSFDVSTTPQYIKNPTYHCSVCKKDINAYSFARHFCLKEQHDIYVKSHELLKKEGLPTACILCSDFNCRSRPALICHLLCQHTVITSDCRCPICNDQFKSKDVALFAAHAMDVHVPEIALNYRKAMFEAKHVSTTNKLWVCLFPSKCYRNVRRNKLLKDCNCHLDNFVDYTSHILLNHAITPLFLSTVDKDLICKPCQLVFDSVTKRKRHEYDYHFEKIKVHYQVSKDAAIFHKQYSPELTCLECYEQFESFEQLQSHIVSAHNTESWNVCGFCSREYSFVSNYASSKIIFAQMLKHEQHHTRQLDALRIFNHTTSDLEKEELVKVLQSNYFATIDLVDFRKKQSTDQLRRLKLSAKQKAWFSHIGVKNRVAQDLF